MNMRKNTKNNLGNRGFSLVELIVVISIMAILAAVAVIGVSVYVDKAAEAADRQTITDIEDALILGAYSDADKYTPGVIGAIGIGKDGAEAGNEDIAQIMEKAFGPNWENELKLQSEIFEGSDEAKLLAAITANKNLFASVPDSSFYKIEGNTDALVSDVDEIAAALTGVLDGIGGSQFSMFWGDDFHKVVDESKLDWNNKDSHKMAANLTVFAAANQINKVATSNEQTDKEKLAGWTSNWGINTPVKVTSKNEGYVADLVMCYAQCVAAYNWALTVDPYYAKEEYGDYYARLEADMVALKNPSDEGGYIGDFNTALNAFWEGTGTLRDDWRNSGAAKKDAEAFLASMMAVNSLEENYVNQSQKDLLNNVNAFENAGAADVLETMVDYSEVIQTMPAGEYVIVLSIATDGTPVVTPELPRN